jgi:hypothetical protein
MMSEQSPQAVKYLHMYKIEYVSLLPWMPHNSFAQRVGFLG